MNNIFVKILRKYLFCEGISCVICGDDLNSTKCRNICNKCRLKLPLNNGRICLKCGAPLENNICKTCKNTKHYFNKARAPFKYEGNVRKIIHLIKFKKLEYLCTSFTEELYYTYLNFNVKCDAIMAIPMHKTSLQKRGFNQAYSIANDLNKFLNLEDLQNCISKYKSTPTQSTLKLEDRKKNLKNVFKVYSPSKIKDKTILLIDDIFTTGATVNEVSKVLKRAGAKEIYVLTISHAG